MYVWVGPLETIGLQTVGGRTGCSRVADDIVFGIPLFCSVSFFYPTDFAVDLLIAFLSCNVEFISIVVCKIAKEGFYLTTHSTHLVVVIWRRTYGKGPFR